MLDGYLLKVRSVTLITNCDAPNEFPHIGEQELELVHNNLGWGGYADGSYTYYGSGWYHMGLFDTNGNKESSNTYKSVKRYDYQLSKKLIVNIK